MNTSPLAGKTAPESILTNIPRLISAYYSEKPDPSVPAHRVSFGTSGHRGSSLNHAFNEDHILAITQAICIYRQKNKIDGPLFLGMDTHALSIPAHISAIEVLAANGVNVMVAANDEYTPTPAISHAILTYNENRTDGQADGIVITPSHNPPVDGGFKYNPPHGGPAESPITSWIEQKANEILENELKAVRRMTYKKASKSATTHEHNYIDPYVADLSQVVNMHNIRDANLNLAVDPLGGAGVHYWGPIAEKYNLNLDILNKSVDPTFRFMTVDWDGKIRMDPSSPYAMAGLVDLKEKYDVAFGCDTDHDRHGIVTGKSGLLQPNHFLSSCVYYLFNHRPQWSTDTMIGKTLVSSQMIDRVAKKINRKVLEVPVGFKWFVEGMYSGSLGFVGEESAGASFLRTNGKVWATDKDGIIACLLAAEMKAVTGQDPGEIYAQLSAELGEPVYDRVEAIATPEQKQKLSKLSPAMIQQKELAGEKITDILTNAPGNGAPIGGLKVTSKNGWFAARPSGTEDIYKIYAESFLGNEHLKKLIGEAQEIVDKALK
ncbi:phosphoglucomutase (alpha-D-glucose-1,6-bisphosphate-dependent) [Membranicola marinus]|uniref:Phosphoglucomutase (Alpha-D-glucose-1,6-bisphosphate-dependent) n=1 Tax=Membranihabitans marinus TaxID=1227546 RepID=A0A953HQ99_9BACT|nr:phosphoglucomutase (alpha-D-glucose-1,6-bisphosphate-dependent) [Membranihabitans marinus]MBY5959269.1 phosphoglucomutase (alpha-D-glucose-1,6-bisphosphate-dependent) [Membranihabitans marinus]